jgi:hypothetical protein
MHLLTASRVACWSRCPRQHHYRYDLGARPVCEDAEALRFGTRIHAGLEAWWTAHQHGDSDRALAAALRAATCETLADYDAARASAMLRAYDARWGAWARECTVLAVEAQWEAPLHDGLGTTAKTWALAGKIDALVVLPDGRTAIVEHKTASGDVSEGSDYRRKLALDGQVSMYFHGATALLGRVPDFCLYDVLVKPACKPLTATPVEARKYTKDGKLYASQREVDETPEAYAERCAAEVELVQVEVLRSSDDLAAHMADLWESVHAIEATRRRGSTGARHTTACFDWHRACDFLEVCESRASIDDSTRFRRLPIHQELSK